MHLILGVDEKKDLRYSGLFRDFCFICLGSDDDVLTQAVNMGNVVQRARCSHGEVPIARDFARDDLCGEAHRHGA